MLLLLRMAALCAAQVRKLVSMLEGAVRDAKESPELQVREEAAAACRNSHHWRASVH